jgi:DNA-binding CsgD family transcriptional regulator
MSISISSSIPIASSVASVTLTKTAPPPAQTTANNPAYVVKLTQAQEVVQLSDQGQSVSQIAGSLSLTVPVVNSYLGITTPST